MSWAWALGSPPFCGGQLVGGGVPVGAGLGLGDGEAEGVGDGRATLGLGLGVTVGGGEVGAGDGVTDGTHATRSATARGVIRGTRRPCTFVV